MFKKILVANRGEIACRVMKTAKRMGIRTVAVYSDADARAPHVEMADEAIAIGPSAASASYLVIENIIDACRKSGAEAVHPGYGFLSENPLFAKALAAAGIAFIGPNLKAIEVMGDKIQSKKFANEAKVSTVPGYLGEIGDPQEALRIAEEIGFPVMIKASAGGGGKGMRIARTASEVSEGFQLARSEARSSFGDDRVFIEKYVEEPRHIEIQVLGDKHGNVIYLGERECSIQRRNQKVIEEAPSSFLDEKTRKAMGEQSVALAKAVNYESAGTVEFIVDRHRNFYFLEMNTRLQVEHPVTELITGIDLVEQMIRVAYGEALAIRQRDVTLTGWAIESRIYAEDPFRGFLPSIGRLTAYQPPEEGEIGGITVRNDTGVREGSEISMFYDPMIAKLCTHAPSRREATEAMSEALDEFIVEGISHNVPFLSALMAHPRWMSGDISTAFIAQEFPDGFSGMEQDERTREAFIGVTFAIGLIERMRRDTFQNRLRPHDGAIASDWVIMLDREQHPVALDNIDDEEDFLIEARLSPKHDPISIITDWEPGDKRITAEIDGRRVHMHVRRDGPYLALSHQGINVKGLLMRPQDAALFHHMPIKEAADTSKFLLCPMPGLVVSVNVSAGQKVQAGEPLATIEAMKMENVLRAESDSTIKTVWAKVGESLSVDAVIMEFE
ncbi:MAG: acetyl/propionyl/methylcrotonyl-CoA carboxylase subunit alpha [Rhizobiales bacterium]|nr:acetyl/propionyl/methylcrotonyl-CoA carboxylase subunit alpha [Hyphomicrobiales bacterium]